MWHVYMVRCEDDSLYAGVTTDIERRMREHNAGKGARYTRSRRPVALVYTEKARSQSEALQREVQIKKMTKQKKENLVQGQRKDVFTK